MDLCDSISASQSELGKAAAVCSQLYSISTDKYVTAEVEVASSCLIFKGASPHAFTTLGKYL